MSRSGHSRDYLVVMRSLVTTLRAVLSQWRRVPGLAVAAIASPIWMDISPNDTLQKESARENEDERHICLLQLEVIRRALSLVK